MKRCRDSGPERSDIFSVTQLTPETELNLARKGEVAQLRITSPTEPFPRALQYDYLLEPPSESRSPMTKRSSLKERLSTRSAKTHGALRKRRVFRWLGGRGAATLVLGAALSVGGAAEVMDNVHFVVRKDLDGVRVVENSNGHRQVVASLADGFPGNSAFRLSPP